MRWKFTLKDSLSILKNINFIPLDKLYENEWGILSTLGLWIKALYSWDGATAVSDGPINPKTGNPYTWRATLVHDWMYQFAEDIAAAFGISVYAVLKFADEWFRDIMIEDGVEPWRVILYYRGVRVFGYSYHKTARLLKKLFRIP